MLGWLADSFRLWWGLLYWNSRKSWFQLRRGRSACPCQSPSDSGRARETRCDACIPWHKPERFRRVCPLLVQTPEGLRCSANTPEVRPFWGRAFGYYGAAALSVYAVAVLAVFIFLRTVGYPVSIVHVGLPPLWHKVGQARGWFFLDRSHRAFEQGRALEGLLYLENAYQFDPANYVAGLALAKNLQAGRPGHSDEVFQKLLRDHPDKRHATAQDWFRALLARGNFQKIAELARDEVLADGAHAPVWMRALLFATSRTGENAPLHEVLAGSTPVAQMWRPLLEPELLLRAGRKAEARQALEQPWPADLRAEVRAFTLFHRVNTLIDLGDTFAGIDLLLKHPAVLDYEARTTLLLDAYATSRATKLHQQIVDELLAPRLTTANLSLPKILCAHLIRHPNAAIFGRLVTKVQRELPLNTETAGIWFSLLCAAGAVGDQERLHELTGRLKQASKGPFLALGAVEAFFRGQTVERRIAAFLPILPLPLEVTYALHERFAPVAPPAAVAPKRA